ncbi:PucR family transcriptional regulator ligand-binding domain-containing protein [Streptomyces cadmiisoli]|uniref:helix-turn-helix domain-containing protein n=1 Tax=Streptomyces cadmiisoli TaxID=2184053 RepID=UPI003D72A25E
MALLVSDLVAHPELQLTVVAGGEHLDRPVLAAHASELVRPGPWLQGGELLMTMGLLLPMDVAACRAYVDDAAAGGAHALALGLGPELPYQQAPGPLVAAAAAAGMPLLTVGREVPFIAVTKTVFAAQASEQRAAVECAFETQRRLTAAAAAGGGLTPTLDAWTKATGVRAHVTDPLGRVIAADGSGEQEPGGSSADLIGRVAAAGIRSSAVAPGLEVQPLGARRLRGMLVLSGDMGADARMLIPGLVSLLSLELERRHLADEPERRHRAAMLGKLLDESTTAEQAADVLAGAGLAADTVCGVVVEVPADDGPQAAREIAADLALAVPGGLIRNRGSFVEAVVGAGLDVDVVITHFAPGCPAGIGSPVPPRAARSSLREAAGLVEISRGTGQPARARRDRTSGLLLDLGDRSALTGYADALLGPLDTADPSGSLTRTLATWLDSGSSWDETARQMGLHRHTVRNRLDKIMQITGRRLDDGDDRFDLWLAVRARRAARRV